MRSMPRTPRASCIATSNLPISSSPAAVHAKVLDFGLAKVAATVNYERRRADRRDRDFGATSHQSRFGDGDDRLHVAGAGERTKNLTPAQICFHLARCCMRW